MASRKSSLGSENRFTRGSEPMSSASLLIWLTRRTCLMGLDQLGNPRLLERGAQFVERLRAAEEGKSAIFPGAVYAGRYQDVGVQHHTHQPLPGVALARRSRRTSRTASSMMRCSCLRRRRWERQEAADAPDLSAQLLRRAAAESADGEIAAIWRFPGTKFRARVNGRKNLYTEKTLGPNNL